MYPRIWLETTRIPICDQPMPQVQQQQVPGSPDGGEITTNAVVLVEALQRFQAGAEQAEDHADAPAE